MSNSTSKRLGPPRLFVLIREDLSHSQAAVQSIHAAVQYVGPAFAELANGGWHNGPVVLLGVKGEEELLRLAEKLRGEGAEPAIFREEDMGGAATAAAFLGDERTHRITRPLPLYGSRAGRGARSGGEQRAVDGHTKRAGAPMELR